MSSIDESVHYVGESRGDDPFEATSRRSGSPLPSYVAGRRWSLRQVARHLLDESSEEEEDVGEEEGSSPGEMEPPPKEERVSSGNRASHPEGSAWVVCGLRQLAIYKLVEEFAILPEYIVSLPPPDSHPSSPPSGYMSFFVSQLRAGLHFPIPSFFREVSCDVKVPLNQLVPNSIWLLAAFSIVLRYNNLVPTSGLFCQCFQLKRTEPGDFHFAPRRGVSFLPTPSPPKHWKDDIMFSKYLRDEHRAALTPPATRFSRGTPSSSDQRGKQTAPALSGSSSKRSKPSSSAFLRNSSTRLISTPPPPPPLRDLGAGSSKSPPSSSEEVYTHLMLSLVKDGAPGRAADIVKGALPAGDKRLLSFLSSEDLDQMLTLVLTKVRYLPGNVLVLIHIPFAEQFLFLDPMSSQAFILRGESLSRASGGLGRSQGEASAKGLEERVEHMQGEMDDLKVAKKEAVARCQKAKKEVKRLQREVKALQEEHAEELRAHADQVRKEFPETDEGKNLLEVCWASCLAEHKKSDAYQKEVALVVGPFLLFAFEACRQQFLAQVYPPTGMILLS
ncbi:UNVERIFIED_CONTAM: hypothetical protein Slati_1354100 [Sesamum latifolium]|uniref:Uncharacterized protein n=1 Tax=Sesamum latifolium TaxID=2727402 RepID=A0AAW2XI06_9LAMI